MAITKTIKAPTTDVALEEHPPLEIEVGEQFDVEDVVNRCIALDAEVAKILEDPRIKELAALKKDIKDWVDARTKAGLSLPSVEVILHGEKGRVEFSTCSMKRDVTNKGALLLAVGEKQFMDMAKFALGDIDKYTSEEVRQQVLTVDPHGGARSMKIVHTA